MTKLVFALICVLAVKTVSCMPVAEEENKKDVPAVVPLEKTVDKVKPEEVPISKVVQDVPETAHVAPNEELRNAPSSDLKKDESTAKVEEKKLEDKPLDKPLEEKKEELKVEEKKLEVPEVVEKEIKADASEKHEVVVEPKPEEAEKKLVAAAQEAAEPVEVQPKNVDKVVELVAEEKIAPALTGEVVPEVPKVDEQSISVEKKAEEIVEVAKSVPAANAKETPTLVVDEVKSDVHNVAPEQVEKANPVEAVVPEGKSAVHPVEPVQEKTEVKPVTVSDVVEDKKVEHIVAKSAVVVPEATPAVQEQQPVQEVVQDVQQPNVQVRSASSSEQLPQAQEVKETKTEQPELKKVEEEKPVEKPVEKVVEKAVEAPKEVDVPEVPKEAEKKKEEKDNSSEEKDDSSEESKSDEKKRKESNESDSSNVSKSN